MHKKCSVDGCEKKSQSHGMCCMHAMRLKRYGRLHLIRRENGTGNVNGDGYIDVSINGRRTYEHILVAEKALGKRLPTGAVVHHVDENKSNNVPANLVVCPDEAYHRLIHRRMDALDACGNPDFRKCPLCEKYDDPEILSHQNSHAECLRKYRRERYQRNKQV